MNGWDDIVKKNSDEVGIGLKKNPKKPNRQIRKLTKPERIHLPSESSSNQSLQSSPKNSDYENKETEKPRKRLIKKLVKPGSIDRSNKRFSTETPAQGKSVTTFETAKDTLKSAQTQLQHLLDLKDQTRGDSEVLEFKGSEKQSVPSSKIMTNRVLPNDTSRNCKDICQNFHEALDLNANFSTVEEQSEDEPKKRSDVPRSIRVAKLFERLKLFKADKTSSDSSPTSTPSKKPPLLSSSFSTPQVSPPAVSLPKPTLLIQQSKLRQPLPASKRSNLIFRKFRQPVTRNINFELDSVTYSRNQNLGRSKCFNCGSCDHTHESCNKPSIGRFCNRCGYENVTFFNCPFCKDKFLKPAPTKPNKPTKPTAPVADGGDLVW